MKAIQSNRGQMSEGHRSPGLERELFLEALSAYLDGSATTLPESIDMSLLAEISDAQQLSPIIHHQTGLPELQPMLAYASYRAVHCKKLLERVDGELRQDNIAYLIFKGPEIARYYRHPQLRLSGDTDILVHQTDKEKADAALARLGFETDASKPAEHEWCYWAGEFEVELHHRLLYDDELNDATLVAFADGVWEHAEVLDGVRYRMEPEFHFVYLLLHIRKHILWAGIGIRQFYDLAVMMGNADLDYAKVGHYIEACGVMRFAQTCFALIERWFGIRCPLGAADIDDSFYRFATDTILSGGAFGDSNTRVDNAVMREALEDGRLASTLRVIFPSRECMLARYPQTRNRMAPLPLLWTRRICESLLRGRAKGGIAYAGKHLMAERRQKEQRQLLDSWGL